MKTIKQHLRESKQINEGTWALPYTLKQAKELENLMKKPLPAKIANDKLYHIIGNDSLADNIDAACEDDKNVDVRIYIRDYLDELIKDYRMHPNGFKEKFDDSAMKILQKLAK